MTLISLPFLTFTAWAVFCGITLGIPLGAWIYKRMSRHFMKVTKVRIYYPHGRPPK